MPLFAPSFIEDLRTQADIVQLVQDYVSLKPSGGALKGLCPFHSEKTPSFQVNRDKGVFHCFGCGAGGDIFKFVELKETLGFVDAVRHVAQRFGVAIPEPEDAGRDRASEQERETLLKIHETAAGFFREQLKTPAGARARQMLRQRGLTPQTIDRLGLGYAPVTREPLKAHLLRQGFDIGALLRSGLVVERDGNQAIDRFRNRLMVPICRESGSVVAFGGRAMGEEQQPKYLNSPETAIYSKGRMLYGLHLTKPDIRRLGYAVLVEGYFDFAQALQAGIAPVVASCGTALTPAQAHVLKRFAEKVVLSFDPDAAGQGAAVRSCDLLVAEGFQVKVAVLPGGADPDAFIRQRGPEAYAQELRTSRPYLEFLLDRAAEGRDFSDEAGRRDFLRAMLAVAARIPDLAARDQFADRLAHKARVLEDVVRAEIRKAAAARRTDVMVAEHTSAEGVKPAEMGLIWGIVHDPATTRSVLAELEPEDLEGFRTAAILNTARALTSWPAETMPETLLERLSTREATLVSRIAASPAAPAPPHECVLTFKRARYERERAAVQREIDRLQELGAARHDREIVALWARKRDLAHRLEELGG
jgi:DNA primase